MTNNNLSKREQLEQKRLEVLEEKKAIDLKNYKKRIVAGAVALTLVGSGIGYGASVLLNNDEPAIAADESENTKTSETPNDNYYIESEVDRLENEITNYFNSLDDLTKSEFNNNPQYLIDFGKWINGLKIDNFSEDYILQIYEMINNANDNVKTAFMNNQPIQGQMIKASKFIKPTNVNIELFTQREAWQQTILNNPNSAEAFEAAKAWFIADWESLLGLNGAKKFSDFDSQASALALAVNTFELQNLVDKVFRDNNCEGLNHKTPDGSEAFYPLVLPANQSLGIEIDDESTIDYERFYKHEITRLLTNCDNYTKNDPTLDDQNSYGILLEVQNKFIDQELEQQNQNNNTSKLEKITDSKNKAYAVKEMYLEYVSKKDGTHVRVHSNIINS